MPRKLLMGAAALMAVGAGCESRATFTRTCYDVPEAIADVRADTVVLETGLRYIDVAVGTGALAATCTDVTVAYTGQRLDGFVFNEGTYAFIPGTGQAIAGFEQGVVGMRVEGVRRLIIPPELGYGEEPVVDLQTNEVLVPPNSTIVFDVQVLGVQQIGLGY